MRLWDRTGREEALSAVLTGRECFEVTEGEVWFNGKNLLETSGRRPGKGRDIPKFPVSGRDSGVSTVNFLKTAVNEQRKYKGLPLSGKRVSENDPEKMEMVNIDSRLLNRSLNEGFSGGRRKERNIPDGGVEPKLAILDETDSGLDIDALRIVARG